VSVLKKASEIKKLFTMAGKVRLFIILTILRCPFDPLHTAIHAAFLQYAFAAISKGRQNELFQICAQFAVGTFFLFIYNGTVWMIYSSYVAKWTGRIRKNVFKHICSLTLQQIESKTNGEWITRLNSDVQAATAILNKALHLPHAFVASANICVSSIMLLYMSPKIFGLIMAFIIPHVLVNQLFITRPMGHHAKKVQEAIARNTTDMNALLTCAEAAILYDAREFLLERFEKSSLEIRKSNMRINRGKALNSSLLILMGMIGYLVVLLFGGKWIEAGTMTFGALTAALQYRGGLLKSLNMLIDSLININTAMAGIERVNETMNIKSEE